VTGLGSCDALLNFDDTALGLSRVRSGRYACHTPRRDELRTSDYLDSVSSSVIASFWTCPRDRDKISGPSVLIVEHRAGRSSVRELYIAQLGLRLRYAVPKAPKEAELAQAPVTTERILVAMK